MKIKIGPYVNWVGPYQLSNMLFKRVLGEDRAGAIGAWLSDTWVSKLLNWIHDRQQRVIHIKIDSYDTWGMDSTLSLIIAPMLRQLHKTKHGSPHTDDEDAPEHLRSTVAAPKLNEWDTDSNWHLRWDWIMTEMIWAFEQIEREGLGGPAWDDQFISGKSDISWEDDEVVIDGERAQRVVRGPNDTYSVDMDGRAAYYARMQNGFRLFGKYFMALWD